MADCKLTTNSTTKMSETEASGVGNLVDALHVTDSVTTGKGVAKYQALKRSCQACPSKMKCCPKADARKITREEHEDARQVARDIAKKAICDLDAAAKEGRNALRPPQTDLRAGAAPIARSKRC